MNAQKKSPKGRKSERIRIWIRIGLLAALVLAAAALLWLQPSGGEPHEQPTASPVAAAHPTPKADERTVREAAYDKDLRALQDLTQSDAADEATRTQAAERMQRLIADHQSELGVEEALREAGFADCAVLIQNGAMTVIVSEGDMTSEKSASVLSLCVAHTDIGAQNIRIMARGGA